jgi:hypothetical protein
MKNIFLNTITGTPLWVWGLFAYLLYIGFKSTRARVVPIAKLFIMPAILFGLKYKTFLSGNMSLILCYFISLIIGLGIGFYLARQTKVIIHKSSKAIELPGEHSTCILLLSFFCMKYAFGYVQSTTPELPLQYLMIETAISAMFSGYFLGRSLNYVRRFSRASI